MPEEGVDLTPSAELLTSDEILRLVKFSFHFFWAESVQQLCPMSLLKVCLLLSLQASLGNN